MSTLTLRWRLNLVLLLQALLVCACGEDNLGNLTVQPPPLTPSGGTTSTSGGAAALAGASSVLPSAGAAAIPGPEDVTHPWPSSGCGIPLPDEQVPTKPGTRIGYTEWHVSQTGATLGMDKPGNVSERQFFVRVPVDYDANRPYRVVYIGQGCGALHAGNTNTEPLFDEARGGAEQAVYVGLSVPDNAVNPGCYDNNSGAESQEWEAFDLIHTFVERTYCVDNNRIFIAGYSTGGWLANMWGCYFAGTPSPPLDQPDLDAGRLERRFLPKWAIRGRAAITGSLPPNQPVPCNGPAAGLWFHDALDQAGSIPTTPRAVDLALHTNGCEGNFRDGPKRPWLPAEKISGLEGGICQEYTGCPADIAQKYPLVFCVTSGFGHADPPFAVAALTAFFGLMDPAP